MISRLKKYWGSIEERKVTFLYIAGSMMAITVLELVGALFGVANTFRLNNIRLGAGIWSPLSGILALLAIASLFPIYSNQAPKSARNGALFLGIAIITKIGFLISSTLLLVNSFTGLRLSLPFVVSTPYIMISMIATAGAFLLVSYAVFDTDRYPKLLGYTFLIPAFVSLGWIGTYLAGTELIPIELSSYIALSFDAITMLTYLALGYILNNPQKVTNIQIGRYLNSTQHRV